VTDAVEQQAALEWKLEIGLELFDIAALEFDEARTLRASFLVRRFRGFEFSLVAIDVHETPLRQQVARVGHLD
jgi:hypothetical protein